jgi:hypothetical protein
MQAHIFLARLFKLLDAVREKIPQRHVVFFTLVTQAT